MIDDTKSFILIPQIVGMRNRILKLSKDPEPSASPEFIAESKANLIKFTRELVELLRQLRASGTADAAPTTVKHLLQKYAVEVAAAEESFAKAAQEGVAAVETVAK